MTRLSPPKIIMCLCLTTLLLWHMGCSGETPGHPPRQMPSEIISDPSSVKEGARLFKDKCAHCHGKPNEGRSERASFFEPPAMDFTDESYQSIDPAYLYWRIETGKNVEPYRSSGSVMPAWGMHFTNQQIWQIVAFLQSRAH